MEVTAGNSDITAEKKGETSDVSISQFKEKFECLEKVNGELWKQK